MQCETKKMELGWEEILKWITICHKDMAKIQDENKNSNKQAHKQQHGLFLIWVDLGKHKWTLKSNKGVKQAVKIHHSGCVVDVGDGLNGAVLLFTKCR